MKRRIRTKKRPDLVIEVEGPELVDLQRQGLVLCIERPATAKPARQPARRQVTRSHTRPAAPAPADLPAPADTVNTEKEN